jgi:protein required for attachment to host cells
MATTWVVVAHQTGARFMEHRPGFGRHLTLVHEIEHPDGRKKNKDIDSDRAGESFTGARESGGLRAMHHEHSAHDHVIERFAKELASQLARGRAEGRFDDLILVAEPKFLGLLREALDSTTTRHVVSSVTKDLAAVPSRSVAGHIAEVLPL